jgi:NAD(P)-dependent dehydrogenase (short-subunit alcohol dehydrogenase family)
MKGVKGVKGVLITGASGGIGRALCAGFLSAGWRVVATDAPERTAPEGMVSVPCCLASYVADERVRNAFRERVVEALAGTPLVAIVNNAAVQHCGATTEVVPSEWAATLAVNVSAPFLLVQSFLGLLEASRGSVVQITSIHATQTKPGFVAYATSKAALAGLTRALAVDLGGRVRVNAIAPAAISTPMLEAGFEGRPESRAELDRFHPAGRIGQPDEVARAAVWLASEDSGFLTGATLAVDGALGVRLHDPV